MPEAPNPQTENAQAEPHDAEGIDAAAEAFAQLGAQPEQPEEKAKPDPEPEGEADTDAEEADPEADEPTEQLAEVEYEGKTYQVPPELEKALLRQSDYSRRMNEVSAKEKTYEQRLAAIDGIEKAAEARAEVLAEVKAIDAQIEQYKAIDWATAKAENPAGAALAAVELMTLQQQREALNRKAEDAANSLKGEREKLNAEKAMEFAKALDKELPDWRGAAGLRLTEYAAKQGIKPQELAALQDARLILALEKARKFDELQASKGALKEKAKTAPPVNKPGAPRANSQSPKTEAMARLRKSNSIDDAAAAFLALG